MDDGVPSQILAGAFEFDPTQVRLSLIEASQGRSLSTTDRVLQSCYRFDPAGNVHRIAHRRPEGVASNN